MLFLVYTHLKRCQIFVCTKLKLCFLESFSARNFENISDTSTVLCHWLFFSFPHDVNTTQTYHLLWTTHNKNTWILNFSNTTASQPPSLLLWGQLTRWLAVWSLLFPDNPTSPPSEILWTPERWCRLDQPVWSTYIPCCCPGLQHQPPRPCQGSHRWEDRSWRWARWSP